VKGVQAHADRQDQPQRPERAREQLGKVIPGDVLDHLAARVSDRPVAEGDRGADDEITGGAVAVTQRARVTGGDDAPDGRRGLVTEGRIEGKHLAGGGEGLLRASQGDAGLEDRGQVAGVVLNNRVQTGGVQFDLGGRRGPAPGQLGPGPVEADREPARAGLSQRGRRLGEGFGLHSRDRGHRRHRLRAFI
jgi:hypothetical protein